jgi:hypothetical protein
MTGDGCDRTRIFIARLLNFVMEGSLWGGWHVLSLWA